MDEVSYKQTLSVLEKIYSKINTEGVISISGGIVPYLIAGTDSGRHHGDIDFIVKEENMNIIRELLQNNGLYDIEMDSLRLVGEDNEDYGVDTIIDGVTIGFYPYSIEGDTIVQRSFTPQYMHGRPELKTRVLPQMLESDYITKYQLLNGSTVSSSSIEVIRATKEQAGRDKDLSDIEIIDKIGIDEEKYQRVKKSINNSQFNVLEKGMSL